MRESLLVITVTDIIIDKYEKRNIRLHSNPTRGSTKRSIKSIKKRKKSSVHKHLLTKKDKARKQVR